jgi:hypothetical protein
MAIITVLINSKSKLEALVAFLNSLRINFKFEKEYNADFLEKIKQSEREIADGKTVKVNKDNLNEYLGL